MELRICVPTPATTMNVTGRRIIPDIPSAASHLCAVPSDAAVAHILSRVDVMSLIQSVGASCRWMHELASQAAELKCRAMRRRRRRRATRRTRLSSESESQFAAEDESDGHGEGWIRTLGHMSRASVELVASRDCSYEKLGRPMLVRLPDGFLLSVRTVMPGECVSEVLDGATLACEAVLDDDDATYVSGVALPSDDDGAEKADVVLGTSRGDLRLFHFDRRLLRLRLLGSSMIHGSDAGKRVSVLVALSERLVVSGDSDQLFVWDVLRKRRCARLSHPGLRCAASLGPNRFASGSCNGSVRLWAFSASSSRWSLLRSEGVHSFGVSCLAGDGLTGGRFVSGGDEGDVRVSTSSSVGLGTVDLHRSCRPCSHMFAITCVAALAGDRVVSGDRYGVARVWDWRAEAAQWQPAHRACLVDHEARPILAKPLKAAVVLSDGRLATATDSTIRVWE